MVICPKCGNLKVFRFRLDSDWAYGMGDYSPANDRAHYSDKERNMGACDRPDIDVFHCRQCGAIGE